VLQTREPVYEPIWSPEGGRIVATLGMRGAAVVDLAPPFARRVPQLIPRQDGGGPFFASAWSPDGTRLVGGFSGPGVIVYSFAERRCRRLTEKGSRAFWLADGRRLVYVEGGKLYLLDEETGASRELLAPPPGSEFTYASAGPGDRTLCLVRSVDEGDIALLSLR
jgi:WD40-like Beta Propeller Repeat